MGKRKMTDADREEAYRMRLEGASLQDVADRFGVSRQWVAQMVPIKQHAFTKLKNGQACIYPAIRRYMEENRFTYHRLAVLSGISPGALYQNLTGQSDFTKKNIDKLLGAMGMTYEEAFQ